MKPYGLLDAEVHHGSWWPKVEACYSRSWSGYSMAPHFHNRAEIMYVLKGWGNIHIYDYRMSPVTQDIRISGKRTEKLTSGEFIFLDQGLLHDLEVPEESYMLNAEFCVIQDESALLSLERLAASSHSMKSLLESGRPCIRGRDDSGKLLRILEQVVTEFSMPAHSDGPGKENILMAELLLQVAGSLALDTRQSPAYLYARGAAEYISAHLTENLTVREIAGKVGVSPAYLQRTFRQCMGMTLVEYINRLRVDQGKKLLLYTDAPIVEVAMTCGFNSRQHFFRVFSAVTGQSPQKFRQESAGEVRKQIYIFENVDDHSYDSDGKKR